MRKFSAMLSAAGLLLVSVPVLAAIRPHHHSSAHAIVRHSEAVHSRRAEHPAFPSMAPERAAEIQAALIKRGYLSGDPTGTWDSASVAAMQKLQGDNGWQTKLVPDSRALIKLGLGPNAAAAPDPSLGTAAGSQAARPAGLVTSASN